MKERDLLLVLGWLTMVIGLLLTFVSLKPAVNITPDDYLALFVGVTAFAVGFLGISFSSVIGSRR